MARVYTVDASVFLNAFNPREPGNESSRRLLDRIRRQGSPIVVPWLLLPEIAATVARGRGDAELAQRFAGAVGRLPSVVLIALDESLARQAVEVAADRGLRGSDAVYVGVAQRFGSTLVTLDREQRERAGPLVTALTPAEALADTT
jgi:predicted nucleic acid-binding protein